MFFRYVTFVGAGLEPAPTNVILAKYFSLIKAGRRDSIEKVKSGDNGTGSIGLSGISVSVFNPESRLSHADC
jgi:hypothetical protein